MFSKSKKTKVAINGFGRIGRATLQALLEKKSVEVVAINDLTDIETLVYLLKHDTCYGCFAGKVRGSSHHIYVNDNKIAIFAEKDPSKLPWKDLGVDVVLECTGKFRDEAGAGLHIQAGAKKVIISAPAKGKVKTVVLGVNDKDLKKTDKIISMASCTTNCFAPITAVIKKNFGIKKAFMTTIHAYTADQNLVDGPHKDLRRARAAAENIVPTSTGAASAAAEIIPSLAEKFDGMSIRVPVPVGSICDITALLSKKTSVEAINKALTNASKRELKNIMEVSEEELVSSDIVKNPASGIVDLALTKVVDGDLIKIVAWYDNEWGYSNRLADLTELIGKKYL